MGNHHVKKFRHFAWTSYDWTSLLRNLDGSINSASGTVPTWRHYEHMDSFNHPAYLLPKKIREKISGFDLGGPMTKLDIKVESLPVERFTTKFVAVAPNRVYYLNDRYFVAAPKIREVMTHDLSSDPVANATWMNSIVPAGMSNSEMDQYGTAAIALISPTNPVSDLATALGELMHDGLPSIPGRAEGNVGSEYLNLQFGWSPLLKDGKDFLKATRNFDNIAKQYIKDSGKHIRRRFGSPPERSSTSTVQTNQSLVALTPNTYNVGGQETQPGTLTTVVQTERYKWFSGCFTYHLPDNVLLRDVALLDKTYGLKPGLDTLWQLTPWSWLLDWFGNAGMVIKNFNSLTANGLVMPWGYVMCSTEITTTYTWRGNIRSSTGVFIPVTVENVLKTKRLQRRQATPYGFGLSWDGFNSYQLGILAALGISRAL